MSFLENISVSDGPDGPTRVGLESGADIPVTELEWALALADAVIENLSRIPPKTELLKEHHGIT